MNTSTDQETENPVHSEETTIGISDSEHPSSCVSFQDYAALLSLLLSYLLRRLETGCAEPTPVITSSGPSN